MYCQYSQSFLVNRESAYDFLFLSCGYVESLWQTYICAQNKGVGVSSISELAREPTGACSLSKSNFGVSATTGLCTCYILPVAKKKKLVRQRSPDGVLTFVCATKRCNKVLWELL